MNEITRKEGDVANIWSKWFKWSIKLTKEAESEKKSKGFEDIYKEGKKLKILKVIAFSHFAINEGKLKKNIY